MSIDMFRYHLGSMTTSFRYPRIMIGFHPTLKVPPVSTIYGLLSSAKGSLVNPEDSSIGYVFEYDSIFTDLETFYQIEALGQKGKSNILKREQLFNVNLWLYVDEENAKFLDNPKYPLFLGRSSDLIYFYEKKMVKLINKEGINFGKSCFPFLPQNSNKVIIQALPTYFTDEVPRKPKFLQNYFIIDDFVVSGLEENDKIFFDEEKNWGVFIYDHNFFS